MWRNIELIGILCGWLLATVAPVNALEEDVDLSVFVLPAGQHRELTIPWSAIFKGHDLTPTSYDFTRARHGTWIDDPPHGFKYRAGDGFEEVGSDSLTLRWRVGTAPPTWHTVIFLAAELQPFQKVRHDLEISERCDWQIEGAPEGISIHSGTHLQGENVLRTRGAATRDSFLAYEPSACDERETPIPPSEVHAGGTTVHGSTVFSPPPLQDPPTTRRGQAIYQAGAPHNLNRLQIRVIHEGGSWLAQVVVKDSDQRLHRSALAPLPGDGPWRLGVDFDILNDPTMSDTARLWLVGNEGPANEVVSHPTRLLGQTGFFRVDEDWVLSSHRFGILGKEAGGGLDLDLDELYVRIMELEVPYTLSHRDDFQGATFAGAWKMQWGRGVHLAARAALIEHRMVEISLARQATTYLFDPTPEAEPRAFVRFDVDPRPMKPGSLALLLGMVSRNVPDNKQEHLRVWVWRNAAGSALAKVESRHGTGWKSGAWRPLAENMQRIEVAVCTAPCSESETTGRVESWIEGRAREVLAGLDNGAFKVDSVRFGAMGVRNGQGRLYLDNYELWVPHPEEETLP